MTSVGDAKQDIGDDEVKAIVDNVVAQLPKILTDLFGVELKTLPKLTKEKKEEAYREIKRFLIGLKSLTEIKEPPKNAKEILERVDALGQVLGPFTGVPKGIHFLDHAQKYNLAIINVPATWGYIKNSNYRKYRDTLSEIVLQLYRRSVVQSAEKFLGEFENSSDAYVMAQATSMRLSKHLNYLKDSRRKLEKRQLAKLIEIYREMAGMYEKLIRLIVGLMNLLDGEETSYLNVAKRRLPSNVGKVGKKYPVLTQNFNITIRNAIAHTSYFLHLGDGTIDFIDTNSKVTLTFRDFLKECRALSPLVLALSYLRIFMGYRQMKNYWDHYKKLKRKTGIRPVEVNS